MTARKRFYKTVTVTDDDGGLVVRLDDRVVKSPAGANAILPSRELADAVATEWDSQGEEIDAASMPLFSLAVTVLDRVTPQRVAIIDELVAYGGNDLLCYQDADDPELGTRQARGWTPWIDWARASLGAELVVAAGVMPVAQPAASLVALGQAVTTHDDWELGMLYRATTLGGSLVLGLAMLRDEMDSAALFETAFLDELWQAERWGSDWEAEDRRAGIRVELDQTHRFLGLLRAGGR
ncbi:MAG: ATP12 family chaperone protein [Candidatus Puniceispirillaceae bacterium]|jgi:chaperone required for assembly of F1-ATPase